MNREQDEQARRLGCTAAEVIHAMCEELRKQTYLRELEETFDLLLTNREQLDEFEAEQQFWDSTVADGLDGAFRTY